MKPPKSILDRSFKYVPASNTNIRETFERIKREAAVPKTVTNFRKVNK